MDTHAVTDPAGHHTVIIVIAVPLWIKTTGEKTLTAFLRAQFEHLQVELLHTSLSLCLCFFFFFDFL